LYPCYFCFQTDNDTVSKRSPKFNIRLFNKGSEPDAYNVKVSTATGQPLLQFSTDTLQPNRSDMIPFIAVKRLHRHEKLIVTVTSQTNPDFERRSSVWVGK
jgi:hypothetical protein